VQQEQIMDEQPNGNLRWSAGAIEVNRVSPDELHLRGRGTSSQHDLPVLATNDDDGDSWEFPRDRARSAVLSAKADAKNLAQAKQVRAKAFVVCRRHHQQADTEQIMDEQPNDNWRQATGTSVAGALEVLGVSPDELHMQGRHGMSKQHDDDDDDDCGWDFCQLSCVSVLKTVPQSISTDK